MQTTHGNLAYT